MTLENVKTSTDNLSSSYAAVEQFANYELALRRAIIRKLEEIFVLRRYVLP